MRRRHGECAGERDLSSKRALTPPGGPDDFARDALGAGGSAARVPARGLAWIIAAILTAAYIAVVADFSAALPLQDYPNHLARAVVMADLMFRNGADFAGIFQYHFLAVPYVLGDLVLAAMVNLFGATIAAGLWNALVMISLPLAVCLYLRTFKVSRDAHAFAIILSLYLSTDWFFVKGFLAFRLAIAAILVGLSLARLLRHRWSMGLYLGYCVAAAAGYLVHLTVTIFEAAAIGVSAVLSLLAAKTSLRRESAILIPIGAALVWQFAAGQHRAPTDVDSDYYFWGTLPGKVLGMDAQFMRYSSRTDVLMMLGFAACVVWPTMHGFHRSQLMKPAVLETLALAGTFVALYFILPVGYADAWYVDARASEMAVLFLVFACLLLPDTRSIDRGSQYAAATAPPLAAALAALLAIANLIYLTHHFAKDHAWLGEYRRIVASVPRGASVLPVYNQPLQGAVRPFLHAGSYVVIDRKAVIPYLFSADGGYPMAYFRYVNRVYAPDETWYRNSGKVDWSAVACNYEFLLVMSPFERSRIELQTTTVAENRAAALLAVARSECPARMKSPTPR
jgi:hypothetical protein